MTTHLALLPSPELVLLPGMVVPVRLDGEAQAAVDTARAAGTDRLLIVPRQQARWPLSTAVSSSPYCPGIWRARTSASV